MIKVTTLHRKVYEGELFAIDPVTKSVSIKSAQGVFSVINATHITNISGVLTEAKAADFAKLGVQSVDDLESKEQMALKQIEKSLANVNVSVASEIQSLFDRFSNIYPTKWSKGNSIEILDEYVIESPYMSVRVVDGKPGKALERITNMLEGERRKLFNA